MKPTQTLLPFLLLVSFAGAQQTPPTKPAEITTPAAATSAPTKQTAPTPIEDLPDTASAVKPQPTGATVILDTSLGRLTCRFFDKQAPLSVANFVGLANGTKDYTDPATNKPMHHHRYYDGTTFHRVIPGFMIQGGDPTGTGMGGPGYEFKNEQDPNLNFDVPGRLAMANAGRDTNGSQFFVTELPYPPLNQGYTIFGQCDDASVEVVKAIAHVERDGQDKPLKPVVLQHVTIVREGEPIPPAPPVSTPTPAAQPQTK